MRVVKETMNEHARRRFLGGVLLTLCALVVVGVGSGERLADAAKNNVARLVATHALTADSSADVCPSLKWVNAAPPPSETISSALHGLYTYAAQDAAQAQIALEGVTAPTAVDLFWLGCAAWRAGDKARALDAWRDARAEMYFLNRAEYAYQNQDVTLALALYEIDLQLAPDSTEGWNNLAEMQFDRAAGGRLQWSTALITFERELRLDPNNAMAHYRVGYGLWMSREDWDRAESELRFAWTLERNWLIAYALGSLLVDRGKSEAAVELLEYALSKSDNAWTRFNLMRAYAAAGRCDEALGVKKQTLEKFPEMMSPLRALCTSNHSCVCESNP